MDKSEEMLKDYLRVQGWKPIDEDFWVHADCPHKVIFPIAFLIQEEWLRRKKLNFYWNVIGLVAITILGFVLYHKFQGLS